MLCLGTKMCLTFCQSLHEARKCCGSHLDNKQSKRAPLSSCFINLEQQEVLNYPTSLDLISLIFYLRDTKKLIKVGVTHEALLSCSKFCSAGSFMLLIIPD